jgi:hypothetical protein
MIGIVRLWTLTCYLAGGFLDRYSAFLNFKTPLERLVAVRGLVHGLKKSISRELLDDMNFAGALQIASQSNHIDPVLFSGGLTAWLWVYLYKKNGDEEDSADDRILGRWTYYDVIGKRLKVVFFVLAFIMTKNVENAI